MARKASLINTATKGTLDPDLSERIDLKHYYDSLADANNMEVRPQGGYARRAGTSINSDVDVLAAGLKHRLRRRIQPVNLTASMVILHNGGTAANLVDQQDQTTLFTTTAITGSAFVIVEFDLGVSLPIVFVDLTNFSVATAGVDNAIAIEYYDGASWVEMRGSIDAGASSRKHVRTSARTRRFGEWPGGPGGTVVSARNWRVVAKNAAGAGAFSVGGIGFWQERREISPVQCLAFDRSASSIYDLILTERNIDVFVRGASGSRRYAASIPVAIAAHLIDEVTVIQSRDTMLLFHEDIPTIMIVRQGSDTEWNVGDMPSTNVPALSAGQAFSSSQNEIQDVSFAGFVNGDQFVIFVGEDFTAPITYSGPAGLAAAISAAIDTLPGLDAPNVTQVDSVPKMRIEFVGANANSFQKAVQIMPLGNSAGAPVHKVFQQGFAAGGAWFGATTGYARCGFFIQSRVLVAGFRSAPFSWGVSKVGSFDFTSTGSPLTADLGFFRTLDTDQVETIQQIFVGRDLQFFTDSSEWYSATRTLDATQPQNVVRATGQGIKSSVRVVFSEGSTIIVQQGGRTVRDFLFNDVEQSYKAEPLSLLGPHLLTDVIDVAQRKAPSTQEANLIFFINDDGTMVTLSLLRSQDVIGMMRQNTDGKWRAIAGHFNGDVVFVMRRETVAGGADLYLENREPTGYLDAALTVTANAPFTTVSGLDHHEGKEVWAYAGSQLCGPFTVTGGVITIDDDDAATTITVGLMPEVYGRLQKLREKLQNEQPFRPPGRIYELGISLKDTGHLQIRANGTDWREVPLVYMDGGTLDYGELADPPTEAGYSPELPVLDRLVTGDVTIENLQGWSRHPIIEFRQIVPAPLHIKAFRPEVAMRG
ncbi:hypothetical protein [Hyphomicrobium sp. DY-1]|uniref:hypothetical protein n=1 Tax=Hyphomicrobium sp. DY-1 TaxID=3075650 RepID=UPI0039C3DE90